MRYNRSCNGELLALTNQQRKILLMIAQGFENKEIAQAMFVTEGTVKTHVQNIMERLLAQNRAHCVALAVKKGLISLGEVEEGKKLIVPPLPNTIAPTPTPPLLREPRSSGSRPLSTNRILAQRR